MKKKNKKTEDKKLQKKNRMNGFLPRPKSMSEKCIAAVDAFNSGDFLMTRKLSNEILRESVDKKEKVLARDLLKRTGTDYVVLSIALAAVVLVVFIFFWSISQSHP
jgi:hypothetical protein